MMKWLIVYQGVFFNFYVCIVIAALKRSVVSDALNMDIKNLQGSSLITTTKKRF